MTLSSSNQDHANCQHDNESNRLAADNEVAVYRRVWLHPGLVAHFEPTKEGILLEYLPRGDLAAFVSNNAQPGRTHLYDWVHSLAVTLLHFHNARVLIYDLAPRNVLIGDDGDLKIIGFGQSYVFREHTKHEDMKDGDGCTLQCDIFHFGCLLYTIIKWQVFQFDLAWVDSQLPKQEDMPAIDGILLGDVIASCWKGSYHSMEEVVTSIEQAASTERHDGAGLVKTPRELMKDGALPFVRECYE